jgi:lysyl-tRNA synthetase class II
LEDETVKITGRVLTIRVAGGKLLFIDIEGDSAKIQLMATATNYTGDFESLGQSVRRGDIIGVEG